MGLFSESGQELELPKRKLKEKRCLTEKELDAVRAADLPDRERMFVNIMLAFGLRPGEALALQRRHFNFSKMILTIDSAITHVDNRAILKGTKTDSVREIPIPRQLLPGLKNIFRK